MALLPALAADCSLDSAAMGDSRHRPARQHGSTPVSINFCSVAGSDSQGAVPVLWHTRWTFKVELLPRPGIFIQRYPACFYSEQAWRLY